MKKIILLITFQLSLLVSFSFAQPVIEWQKCFGGFSDDYAFDIQQTNDGYIVVGFTKSNDGDVSGNHGSYDWWVVKLNNSESIQWQKCMGGSSYEFINAVKQTNDGGYILAGGTNSNDGDVTGNHGSGDAWVIKLDSAGTLEWQKCYGGTQYDEAYSIMVTSDGGYIFTGDTQSDDGDVSGNHSIDTTDVWIVKIDSAGTLMWQKCYGGTDEEYSFSIESTLDEGYIIGADTKSINGDVTGNHGSYDSWILKIDSVGDLQWQKCFGGSSSEDFTYVHQTFEGGYIVTARTNSNDGNVFGNHGYLDNWVVKLDSVGNLQWQRCLGGTNWEEVGNVIENEGGYTMAGTTYSQNDGDVSGNHGEIDVWLVHLDSLGNLQWQKCFGGSNGESGSRVRLTSDNSYIVAGAAEIYAGSEDGDVTGFHFNPQVTINNRDFWIFKATDNYNKITGKLFADLNSNQILDSNDVILLNKKVDEQNTGNFAFSQTDGSYKINVFDTGSFTVTPEAINYYSAVPSFNTAYFNGMKQTDSLNDFAFQPAGTFNDLCITITPLKRFRANQNSLYMINYENVGTTTLNGTVIFFPDSNITYLSSNPIATSVTTDSIVWNAGTLTPFQTGSILVTVHINAGAATGTLINSIVRIEPVAGDANTVCNYASWEVYVSGTAGPNEILVDRDTVLTTELASPPYLNYIIYFQNIGNDTAFNAKVLNNIPQMTDVTSFEFVSSSHPVNINYSAASRLMEFDFNNINLPNASLNQQGSHGFIRYRIKPLSTLVAGDSINNTAFVYFDFGGPLQTNIALTEIILPTGVNELNLQSSKFNLFPNPTDGLVSLNFLLEKNADVKIEVFNSFGQKIKTVLNGKLKSGKQQITFDAGGFTEGIYFVKMIVDGEMTVRKMVKM